MVNFKEKKALTDDLGLGIEHAVRLGKDFGKSQYYSDWQTAFPSYANAALGMGMENVENIFPRDYFEVLKEIDKKNDLLAFFDIGQGGKAAWLRDMGYNVFGAGKGEILEFDRFKARQVQKEIGLPFPKTFRIEGITKLRIFLKEHPDYVIKINRFRGDRETFSVSRFNKQKDIEIDRLSAKWGPYKDKFPFLCEAFIDGIEIGLDGFFNGQEWIRPSLWGIEDKPAYIGRYDNTLPFILEDFMTRITPTLKDYNYRGAMSTEQRVINKRKGFLIDITARYPFMLSLIYPESILNYSEVIWSCATMQHVKLKPIARYVALVPLVTNHCKEGWLGLEFAKNLRNKVKLETCCQVDNAYFYIPGAGGRIGVITWGNNIDTMIKELTELSDKVDCEGLDRDGLYALQRIKGKIKKLRQLGIDF